MKQCSNCAHWLRRSAVSGVCMATSIGGFTANWFFCESYKEIEQEKEIKNDNQRERPNPTQGS